MENENPGSADILSAKSGLEARAPSLFSKEPLHATAQLKLNLPTQTIYKGAKMNLATAKMNENPGSADILSAKSGLEVRAPSLFSKEPLHATAQLKLNLPTQTIFKGV